MNRGRFAEALLQDFHAADAIQNAVVHLEIDGEALILQPINQMAFPQWSGLIYQTFMQVGHQRQQLFHAPR